MCISVMYTNIVKHEEAFIIRMIFFHLIDSSNAHENKLKFEKKNITQIERFSSGVDIFVFIAEMYVQKVSGILKLEINFLDLLIFRNLFFFFAFYKN